MSKFFKEVAVEKRRVRWSTPKKSTYVFFATLITIIVFVLVISLFSWGVASIMALAG